MSETKFDRAICFSGGIDSTYVLYKELQLHPNDHFLVFVGDISRREARRRREKRSVDLVLQKLNMMGLYNFTRVDFAVYRPPQIFLSDIETSFFMLAAYLRNRDTCKYVYINASKTDREQGSAYELRARNRDKLFNLVNRVDMEVDSDPKIQFLYPIKHMDRRDIIKGLPKDLLRLCYFCRGVHARYCGQCDTCHKTVQWLPPGLYE